MTWRRHRGGTRPRTSDGRPCPPEPRTAPTGRAGTSEARRWITVDVRPDDTLDPVTRDLADWYEREYGRG